MTKSAPVSLLRGYSSLCFRFLIRALTVRGITWIMLALTLLITATVCQQIWRRQVVARQQRFEADAAGFRNAVDERLQLYAHVLQGVSGLFDASVSVDATEFRAYVTSLNLDQHFPGVLALGYVEMVDHSKLEAFLQAASHDHSDALGPFTIKPPGERPDYMVVRFIEPLASNQQALGFDIGSDANRRRTALLARDSATVALTAKLDLAQSPGKSGSILFQPIYRTGSDPIGESPRRALLQGWVYAAFHGDDLMAEVNRLTPHNFEYEIFDGTDQRPDTLLSRSDGHGKIPDRDLLVQTTIMDALGRPWTLRIQRPANGEHGSGFLPLGVLVGGGTAMSLLVFGFAHAMTSTKLRAIDIAKSMTTELRSQDQALRASEKRLSMIIEGSNDGVWDWDMTTDEVYFSPRWKSMLGYEDHEIENTFRSWEDLIHPMDLEQARKLIESYKRGEVPTYKLEHRLRHKNGSYHWILARGVISHDRDGNPIRMAGSHVDLTDLKETERKLLRTNEDLQRSKERLQTTLDDLQASHRELERTQLELIQAAKLESIGTLAAGVAHEVRNPLQIIVMGIDYIDHHFDDIDETSRVTLCDMRDAAQRADSITKELLEFSRSTEFNPVCHNLEVVLHRSLHLMDTELTKSKVTLIKHLDGHLPDVRIDPQRIQQVLINLIHNAEQAMEHIGTLTVITECGRLEHIIQAQGGGISPLKPDDEVVILRLQDTGTGIPDEQLPRIFDPFFTTKAIGSGTGLGLTIAKTIIELHGGLIRLRNLPERGLQVTLVFKTCRSPSNNQPPPPRAPGSEPA